MTTNFGSDTSPPRYIPTASIYGMVTREGGPVVNSNVSVALLTRPDSPNEPEVVAKEWWTVSDQHGRFEFPDLPTWNDVPAFRHYLIRVDDGDWAAHHQCLNSVECLHLTLRPRGSIAGRVLDAYGHPCADIPVYFRACGWSAPDGLLEHLSARTDENGDFCISDLVDGEYLVDIRSRRYGYFVSPPVAVGTMDCTISLRHGVMVSGCVREYTTRERVPGVHVYLKDVQRKLALPWATSDESGTFTFENVPAGNYTPLIGRRLFLQLDPTEIIALEGGQDLTDLEILVEKGVELSGTVRLLNSGEPLVGVDVHGFRLKKAHWRDEDCRTTDEAGRFRLSGLVAGINCVGTSSTLGVLGWYDRDEVWISVPPRPAGAEVLLIADPSPEISGIVVDAAGSPLVGVRLVFLVEDRERGNVITDRLGRFHVVGIEVDDNLLVDARKCPWCLVAGPRRIQRLEDRNNLVLVAEPGAVIAGVVRAEAGGSVLHTHIQLVRVDDGSVFFENGPETDCGTFSIWGVPAGKYRLTACIEYEPARREAPDCILDIASGEIRSGIELVLGLPTFDVRPCYSISGRVVTPDGMPLPYAQVTAHAYVTESYGEVTADENGRFVIESLTQEVHSIHAHMSNYEHYQSEDSPGGATDVVLMVRPQVRLRGRIVARDGERPVQRFSLGLSDRADRAYARGLSWETFYDRSGRFETIAHTQERYLYVHAEGFSLALLDLKSYSELDVQEGIVVSLEPASDIVGKVSNEAGQPVFGTKILLEQKPRWCPCLAISDLDGSFQIGSVGSWLTTLIAVHRDYEDTEISCVCVPGEITSLNVTLRRPSI